MWMKSCSMSPPSELEWFEPSWKAPTELRRRCGDGLAQHPRPWPGVNNTLHSIHTGRLHSFPSGGVNHPKAVGQMHADVATTSTQPTMMMPMTMARNSRSRFPVTNSRHPKSDEPASSIPLHPPKIMRKR